MRSLFYAQTFFYVLFAATSAFAYFESTTQNGRREMNGIFYDQMPVFYKDWALVTVRYRTDSKEMRFTYANDIALKAMKEFNPQYPDGAIFAKIGMATEDDPSFTSSRVPSGSRRFQFMVKDRKKYASTDGWGYALFDANGNVFQDEGIEKKTLACVACHHLVPERDFVFSRAMFFGSPKLTSPLKSADESVPPTITYAQATVKSLPANVAKYLKGFDVVAALQGEVQKNAFSGTLDEIVPLLLEKAHAALAPAILMVDEKNFTLVVPAIKTKKGTCFGSEKDTFRILVQANNKLVRDAISCK